MSRIVGAAIAAIWIGIGCGAARAGGAVPHDLAKWELTCFCNTKLATPHVVVRADDNGRILYAARGGITKDGLKAKGIPFTDSQLILMLSWHLLTKHGPVWTTAMPVLGPNEMAHVRAALQPAVKGVAKASAADVAAIKAVLHKNAMDASAYSVVFNAVLDSLTWEVLHTRHVLTPFEVTADRPIWNGAFWAHYPPRKGVPGTNAQSEGKAEIRLTWTDGTLDAVHALQASDGISALLKAIAAGKPVVPITATDGMVWRLSDAKGRLRVPLIHQRKGDPIYDHGMHIANAMVDALLDKPVFAQLKRDIAHADDQTVIIIAMHEFIWGVLDEFVKAGLAVPPVLTAKGKPSADELNALAVLTLTD